MLRRTIAIAVAVAALTVSAGAASAAPSKNIVETAASAPQFSTLVSLVERAELADALSGDQKLTVFAPTNAAFKKVPKKTLNALLADDDLLRKVLLYHVVEGKLPAKKVVQRSSARTLEGAKIRFAVRGKNVFVNNNSKVVATDIKATNGVIHAINRVLIPPGL